MKGRLVKSGIIVLMILLSAAVGLANECFYCPTGVLHYDAALADNGYNMVGGNILDMKGNILHSMSASGGNLTFYEDGTSIALNTSKNNVDPSEIIQYDWDGNIIWQWTSPAGPQYFLHHDFVKIWNDELGEYTILAVAEQQIDTDEAIEAGSDDENSSNKGFSADSVIEIRMVPQDPEDPTANIIWEWKFWDHVVQYYKPDGVLPSGRSTYGDIANPANDFGRLDLNVTTNQKGSGLTSDWNHVNGIAYNEDRDEIALSARENCEIFIIDHSLSDEDADGPAGDFVYRWGNPYNYTKNEEHLAIINDNGLQQLFGNHHVKWVEPVTPAAEGEVPHKNLLIFENGSFRPQFCAASAIYEINPFDADGNYVREVDATYSRPDKNTDYGTLSDQVVWKFSAREFGKFHLGFYSSHGSNVDRLPNGNTLISASEAGHLIEVTPDLKIAWEYLSGFAGGDVISRTEPGLRGGAGGTRLPYDHPGLAGKTFVRPDVVSPGVWDSDSNLPGFMSGTGAAPAAAPPQPTGWGTSGLEPAAAGGGGVASGGGVGDVGGGY